MRLRHFAARKRKRGASLVMVLVSMTILTIMGTLFTTIAMRSYQYSYSRMCRQQAYYTATSSVESLYAKIKTNGSILNDITTALNDAYEDLNGAALGIDVTTIRVKIGSTHGDPVTEERAVVGSDFFYTYLGECDLWARYNNAKRTEISLEAEATYNGYSETARAIIAKTNAAASELKKIFDNTFCLQSPISTIVAETTHGDIYVSQPIADTDSAGVQNLGSSYITAYNTVFAALSEGGIYNGHSGVPGQYLRYTNGDIITSGNEGKYNKVLRYGVYGNAQASTSNASLVGHTKPLDMDNSLLTASFINQPEPEDLWYNDWAELYMFSAVEGGTAVNGDLYADSKILIGLSDRNLSSRAYLRRWDNTIKRSVFSQQFKGETPWWEIWKDLIDDGELDNYLQDIRFNKIDLTGNFEHGFGQDVFFDHYKDGKSVLDNSLSTFRLNGDMYLWEDARIENFDSYNTANSRENDIFAKKDLYIDGLYITGWNGALMQTTNTVSIGGDVVVQGNAQIMNATIYGDVYCYGDELTIVSSKIHGNVYFDGDNFTSDDMELEGNLVINYTGSNTNVTNYSTRDDYDEDNLPDNMTEYAWNNNFFGTTHDVGGDNTVYSWGATITNSDIYGTLWSNVNTHILISKWDEGGDSIPNYYGDIYVSKYLFIDLTWTYLANKNDARIMSAAKDCLTDDERTSGHRENWLAYKNDTGNREDEINDDYDIASSYNCFESCASNNVIYADRFQFRTNQSDPWGYTIDISYLGKLIVGDGGLYIDGNSWATDRNDPTYWSWSGSRDSICIVELITASREEGLWETKIDSTRYITGDNVDRQLAGHVASGYSSLSAALEHQKTDALSDFSHSNAVEYETVAFKDNAIWKDKLIKIRTWSAPKHSDDPGASTSVNYVGGETGGIKYSTDASDVNGYLYYLLYKNPAAGSVSGTPGNGDYTLTIKQSVCFSNWVDWSAFDRIVIDTSKGNVYIRFLNGVELGKKGDEEAKSYDEGAEVVLTGGSMVFWYLYESDSYNFKTPTLEVNPYTRLGLVSAETGSGYGYDGLYIISNDDSLITMGQNAVLNGYVYTPYGQVFIAPAASSYTALNGCMAIESLIMLSTADELQQSNFGGDLPHFGTEAIIDAVINQYKNIVFNYVQPPLIVDFDFSYGNTEGEISDFGQVVWEFLGYY